MKMKMKIGKYWKEMKLSSELGLSENHTTLQECMEEQASEIETLKSENER